MQRVGTQSQTSLTDSLMERRLLMFNLTLILWHFLLSLQQCGVGLGFKRCGKKL